MSTTWQFVALLLAATWFGCGIAAIVSIERLKRFRTDIGPKEDSGAGSHWVWQVNVLRFKNYSEHGRRRLWTVYVLMAVQMLALLSAIAVIAVNGSAA